MAYTPKTWTTGETITAAELNAIEQGVQASAAAADTANTGLTSKVNSSTYTAGLAGKADLPTGGTDGQALVKAGSTTAWATVAGGTTPDATSTVKGAVQLAGDLAGTAAAPTVPGLAGKLSAASNLSDVSTPATARTNLGLGSAATQPSSAFDASGAAAAAQAAAIQRANHTGTQSADTLTDGTTNKAFLATERTKLAGIATGATAYTDTQAQAANATALAGKAPLLTPTAVKTAAYTAVVGDLAMMNVAGGATALALPTAPADKAQVGYRAIGATTAVPLVVTAGGSDTIGTAGVATASIPLADEVTVLQYQAASTRWLAVSNVKTQASLDARYLTAIPAQTQQAGAAYTLTLADAGTIVELTNSSVTSVTVPPNSSVAFPVGTSIVVRQYGTGQVTLVPGSGVFLRSRGAALTLVGQYSEASLTKRATDEWIVSGDVTA